MLIGTLYKQTVHLPRVVNHESLGLKYIFGFGTISNYVRISIQNQIRKKFGRESEGCTRSNDVETEDKYVVLLP
jgi:hypothetical protein